MLTPRSALVPLVFAMSLTAGSLPEAGRSALRAEAAAPSQSAPPAQNTPDSADRLADHVVLISVDGLRPSFYLEDRWPSVTMRKMAQEGAHARGVRGVHPTVTYPAHATIVTGARPARHGVFYNTPLESGGQTGRWYWEAEHFTTPTLWDAVRKAGGTTASFWWPVTLGADIDWNLPEIWPLDDSDRRESLRAHTTPSGFLEELERSASGPLDDTFRGAWRSRDDRLAAMAAYTFRTRRPSLMLVHFTSTDSHQHSYGREHHLVERALQAVDRGIARIAEQAEESGVLDRTAFVITGDHGFSDIHTLVAPNVWLVDAGLMEDRPDRGNWRATFHTAGGSAFLHLRDPGDTKALADVRRVIEQLDAGTRKLFQVIDRDRMQSYGADPASPLSISGVNGVAMSGARSGPAVRPGSGGTHGHFPDFTDMETGFIAWGAGVRRGARIPSMGLEDVAPVVAHLLSLPFKAPDGVLLPGIVEEKAPRIPARVEAHSPHYRSFSTSDALATYLDARSPSGVLISAHRGGPTAGFPENALPTFENSLAHGPMLLEMDLRASADGRIVIIHDSTLKRTTGVEGVVGELPLDRLRQLRLLNPDGSMSGARLPTLQEALAWAEGRAVLRLDVKSGVTPEMVVAEIRQAGAANRVMVVAQGIQEVARYQELAPELMLSFWHDPEGDGRLSVGAAREVIEGGFDRSRLIVGVGSIQSGWDPAVLEFLRGYGVRGMVSTFGELDRAAIAEEKWELFCPLVEAQVGVIITDAVAEAARAVRDCVRPRPSSVTSAAGVTNEPEDGPSLKRE